MMKRADLGVETKEAAEAQECMALLNVVTDMAQGSTPRPYKMAQMRGNALRADPGNPSQSDSTASKSLKMLRS